MFWKLKWIHIIFKFFFIVSFCFRFGCWSNFVSLILEFDGKFTEKTHLFWSTARFWKFKGIHIIFKFFFFVSFRFRLGWINLTYESKFIFVSKNPEFVFTFSIFMLFSVKFCSLILSVSAFKIIHTGTIKTNKPKPRDWVWLAQRAK